jgi:coatomer protein complex subunit alpha (xenin)
MSMELERRKIQNDESQLKRNLELAAYFTKPLLERPHRQLTLMNAIRLSAKHKNFIHATHFADRVLANNSTGKNAEIVRITLLFPLRVMLTVVAGKKRQVQV